MGDDLGDNLRRIEEDLRRTAQTGQTLKLSTRNGLLGRECPTCERFFEIETSHDLPTMYCPYCGHNHEQSNFLSRGQAELARAAAAHMTNKAIAQAVGEQPSIPAARTGVPVSEQTSQELRCSACRFRFGINGKAAHCPRCGANPA
jgi:Zn finger protein HypA/HybF involved in hydrogenase expression